jgi:hypothetical protein
MIERTSTLQNATLLHSASFAAPGLILTHIPRNGSASQRRRTPDDCSVPPPNFVRLATVEAPIRIWSKKARSHSLQARTETGTVSFLKLALTVSICTPTGFTDGELDGSLRVAWHSSPSPLPRPANLYPETRPGPPPILRAKLRYRSHKLLKSGTAIVAQQLPSQAR